MSQYQPEIFEISQFPFLVSGFKRATHNQAFVSEPSSDDRWL